MVLDQSILQNAINHQADLIVEEIVVALRSRNYTAATGLHIQSLVSRADTLLLARRSLAATGAIPADDAGRNAIMRNAIEAWRGHEESGKVGTDKDTLIAGIVAQLNEFPAPVIPWDVSRTTAAPP